MRLVLLDASRPLAAAVLVVVVVVVVVMAAVAFAEFGEDEEAEEAEVAEVAAVGRAAVDAWLRLGLLGCIVGVYEPLIVAGGVRGDGAVEGIEDVRETAGRDGGRGMVEEKGAGAAQTTSRTAPAASSRTHTGTATRTPTAN